jgi:hypothetical protein
MSENSSDAIPFSEEPQAETTVNKVNDLETPTEVHLKTLCSCGEPRLPSAIFCPHCGQDFASDYETKSEQVVDDDGTTHSGRRIRLIGEGWPNDLVMIKDLSDEQLITQIKGLQDLLKRAIQTADYAQISIASREFELGYRQHSRYVAAVRRREKLTQGSIRLNQKAHKVGSTGPKIPADIAALMALANITYEQAVAMKALLGKTKA